MRKNQFFRLLIISIIFTNALLPNIAFSKTIKTEHWNFKAGFRFGKEKRMVQKISEELDLIWKKVNELLDGTLPPKLKLETTDWGFASPPILEEKSFGLMLNEIHLKKDSPQDAIERIAHESAHVALYRLSNGKTRDWENRFLDEAIATYVGAFVAGKLDYLDHWERIYAKEDLNKGMASLEFLRDWEKNVFSKQIAAINEYMRKSPGRVPKEEEYHQKFGFRSYFTSYSFVKFFMGKYDLKKLLDVLRAIGKGEQQSAAFKKFTGKSLEALFAEWHASLQ